MLNRPFMLQLAGVLFEVHSGDSAAPGLAFDVELEATVTAEWQIVLRNLIALGQIGVEVVLAIELRELGDLAVQRECGTDGRLDRPPVDHWQGPRQPEADGARVRVGRRYEIVGRAPAEHLALRQHLGMDLEPHDDFVARGDRHQAAARINGDWSLRKSAAASKA